MKKSVILILSIIYILSIIIVGTVGLKMRVYNENIYVTSITCENEDYKAVTGNSEYDGYIKINYVDGCRVELRCKANPLTATAPRLSFLYDESDDKTVVENEVDNTITISFLQKGAGDIFTVRSTDGQNCTLKIWIYCWSK